MVNKPSRPEDLLPPFRLVGEPAWERALRGLLTDYGVPIPGPVSDADLDALERALEVSLPSDYRLLLTTFGPVDFGGIKLLVPTAVFPLSTVWFFGTLDADDARESESCIAIVDAAGSGDYGALNLSTGEVLFASHDPPGLFNPVTFSDLVRIAVIDLSLGRYGWDDDDCEQLAMQLKQRLFGFPFWF